MTKLITMLKAAGTATSGWKTYVVAALLLGAAGLTYHQTGDIESAGAILASALGVAGIGKKINKPVEGEAKEEKADEPA